MPRISFTPMTIKSLKPQNRSIEYFEKGREHGTGSLGLRVSPKGKRTWFAMYKTEARKIKRFTLGTYPELTLKNARKKANDTMTEVNNGNDPMQGKQIRRAAPTVSDLWQEYQGALSRQKRSKAPSTLSEEHRRWSKIIYPVIGDMKVEDITPVDISSLLNKVAKKAPVSANRLHALLRVLFAHALGLGWITIHPMQWLKRPGGAEPPRKKILTDEEIKTIWPHIETLRPNPRDALKLGLLSAQRPGEIMRMKWEDVDLEKGIWIIRETKTGNDHLTPLSPQVIKILKDRISGVGYTKKMLWMKESEYVFPSNHNTAKGATSGHMKTTKDARKKVQENAGVTGWTAHDLRRTARTIMSRLKIKQHIRERVLNHAQGGIQGVYDQHDYIQEKADALNKLGREIDRILGIETKAKIIALKSAIAN